MRLRARRSAALLTAVLAGAAAVLAGAAAAQPLPDGAESCLAALTDAASEAAAGDELLYYAGDYCPAFTAALAASPWSANLPIDAQYLGSSAVGALVETAAGYDPARPEALAVDRLDAIVAGLEPFVAEPEPSIWQRLSDWVRGWFEGDGGDETWFSRWLSSLSIPDSWTKPILYTIAALAALAVLAIVLNELRLGGAFVGRTTRALRAAVGGRTAPEVPVPTLDSIRREPDMGRKIELMLTLVIDRLHARAQGLLQPGLTHRELARAAAGLDDEARENLNRVAGAAERVTYADWEPDPEAVDHTILSGESLIRRIDDAAGTPE